MAVVHGKEGVVKFSTNDVGKITKIEVVQTVDVSDKTAMGDTWQDHNVGIPAWSGSVEGWYDPADTDGQASVDVGDQVSIGFYVQGDGSGATYYSGTATVTNITIGAEITDNGKFSFAFQGAGALTKSTVA